MPLPPHAKKRTSRSLEIRFLVQLRVKLLKFNALTRPKTVGGSIDRTQDGQDTKKRLDRSFV